MPSHSFIEEKGGKLYISLSSSQKAQITGLYSSPFRAICVSVPNYSDLYLKTSLQISFRWDLLHWWISATSYFFPSIQELPCKEATLTLLAWLIWVHVSPFLLSTCNRAAKCWSCLHSKEKATELSFWRQCTGFIAACLKCKISQVSIFLCHFNVREKVV